MSSAFLAQCLASRLREILVSSFACLHCFIQERLRRWRYAYLAHTLAQCQHLRGRLSFTSQADSGGLGGTVVCV